MGRIRRRKDSVASFMQGWISGQKIAGDVKNSMSEAEMNDIATAGQQTDTGYTPGQGQQLEAIANAKDENGNPYYSVTAGTDGKYQVTPNWGGNGVSAASVAAAGVIEPGNIDLANRPTVKNPDGSVSTVRSMSANIDGKEVLIPTVSDDGRNLTEQEAIDNYLSTGKHLGKFDTPDQATAYAQSLHGQQEKMYASPDTATIGPKQRTTFLGKVYDTPLSEAQEDRARMMAMSGVMSKYGNPAEALRLRHQARGLDVQELQMKSGEQQLRAGERQEQRDIRTDNQQAAQDAFMDRWKGVFAEAKADPIATFKKYLPQYNNATEGPFGDGSKIEIRGDVAYKIGKDGKELASQPMNEQNIRFSLMDAMHSEGALLNTGRFDDYLKHLQHVQERGEDQSLRREQMDREDKRHKESVGVQYAGLKLRESEDARSAERWNIEKGVLQANADDSKAQRAARKELSEAIESGEDKQVEKARAKAVAAGVKLEKPNNEFSWVPSQGLAGGGTLINKDTGTGATYDAGGKLVTTIAPPGKAAAPAGIPPVGERKVGQPYDTPKGKMIWRGNGWEPVK